MSENKKPDSNNDKAKNILETLKSELKKWNGWCCISISKHGSGVQLHKEQLEATFSTLAVTPEQKAKTIADMPAWDTALVPMQVHREMPTLDENGLYRSIVQRTISFVRILDPNFEGLVMDRQGAYALGDPFLVGKMDATFKELADQIIKQNQATPAPETPDQPSPSETKPITE